MNVWFFHYSWEIFEFGKGNENMFENTNTSPHMYRSWSPSNTTPIVSSLLWKEQQRGNGGRVEWWETAQAWKMVSECASDIDLWFQSWMTHKWVFFAVQKSCTSWWWSVGTVILQDDLPLKRSRQSMMSFWSTVSDMLCRYWHLYIFF